MTFAEDSRAAYRRIGGQVHSIPTAFRCGHLIANEKLIGELIGIAVVAIGLLARMQKTDAA